MKLKFAVLRISQRFVQECVAEFDEFREFIAGGHRKGDSDLRCRYRSYPQCRAPLHERKTVYVFPQPGHD